MKTELERTNDCIVRIYHQYAILDPIDDYLQFKEFKKLMKEQGQLFLKDTIPRGVTEDAYIKQLFEEADKDHSAHLKFTEFLDVLTLMAIDAHNRSHNLDDEGHGHSHHPHGHRSAF